MNYTMFYQHGSAGIVRGIQVGQAIGAKLNPTEGYADDLCIYVKRPPFHAASYPKHTYIDTVDGLAVIPWLIEHPDVGVIAISELAKRELIKHLHRTDIYVIPHHHCNYERLQRPDRPVKVVGIMGSKDSFQLPVEELRKRLADIGLTLQYDEDYWPIYGKAKDPRQKVVDFYKTVDIQVAFRPKSQRTLYAKFRCPLKLENAGSFGIPTVAFPELAFEDEWGDNFLHAHSMDEIIILIKMLKDYPEVYRKMSQKALEKAEGYHMDHIKQLYLSLP